MANFRGESRYKGRMAFNKNASDAPPMVDDSLVPVGELGSERERVVSTKRHKVGTDIRVDSTRVSGPIRFALEPGLWIAFGMGVIWVLVALDPALRADEPVGMVLYEHAMLLGASVGVVLLISSLSALLWLPASSSATRSRTAVAGLGLLGSGWLFTRLHPIDATDHVELAWLSIAVGVLLLAVCVLPWPSRPASKISPLRGPRLLLLTLALMAAGGVCMLLLMAGQQGLAVVQPGSDTGWDELLPLTGLLVILLAVARMAVFFAPRALQETPDED